MDKFKRKRQKVRLSKYLMAFAETTLIAYGTGIAKMCLAEEHRVASSSACRFKPFLILQTVLKIGLKVYVERDLSVGALTTRHIQKRHALT